MIHGCSFEGGYGRYGPAELVLYVGMLIDPAELVSYVGMLVGPAELVSGNSKTPYISTGQIKGIHPGLSDGLRGVRTLSSPQILMDYQVLREPKGHHSHLYIQTLVSRQFLRKILQDLSFC